MVQRGVAGARECVGGTQHNDEEVGAHGLSCVCGGWWRRGAWSRRSPRPAKKFRFAKRAGTD
eukprot:scaffold81249_cov67-Phaeocystis_antarctica.AAC.5